MVNGDGLDSDSSVALRVSQCCQMMWEAFDDFGACISSVVALARSSDFISGDSFGRRTPQSLALFKM